MDLERHGKQILLGFLAVLLIALSACQQAASDETTEPVATTEESAQERVVDMVNPAAVYCEGLGYSYESRETAAGMDADCIFPDESRCGQWDFLSGRCGQEYTYCHQQGGMMLELGTNIGICVFDDGSTCDEYNFFQVECQKGDNPSAEEPRDETQEGFPTTDNGGLDVIGWMGFIINTPNGAQFDDYIVVLPDGEVGEFGIEGINQDVNDQIIALRNHEEPGKYAHFWGKLNCDVIDYGGCQLLVERLRVDVPGEFFEPDQVDGWRGFIKGLSYDEPGAPQPDDAFIPTGDYPVQYGIDSAISTESGERDLNEAIAASRNTGQEVVIWGEVICGVPDAGGCHIEVYRLGVGDEIYEITPMK
jgi:putative hemolysin